MFQRAGNNAADNGPGGFSFGLSSGLLGSGSASSNHGCSSLSVNNVDNALFSLPADISALQRAYVTAPNVTGIGPHGTFIPEFAIDVFIIPTLPHLQY